jgi:hypothetical protein
MLLRIPTTYFAMPLKQELAYEDYEISSTMEITVFCSMHTSCLLKQLTVAI